jgi:hypothetical protein
MKRATSVYVIMLIAFGIGLWGIITTGSLFLRAPHDLSGRWELRERQAGPDDDPTHELMVDQSGRYFRVIFDKQSYSLALVSERREKARHAQLELRNGKLNLQFESIAGSKAYRVQADGAIKGQWVGVRVAPGQRRAAAPAAATTQYARP